MGTRPSGIPNPGGHVDDVLVRLATEGDTSALRMLYEQHAPWLHARLMRRCNDHEVVLDVVQDTFVAVWRDGARWRGEGELAGWLWGIAFRRMVSRLRRRKDIVLLPEWDDHAAAALPAAEDLVLRGVEYGDLAAGLDRLSPDFRHVVQAVVLDGLTAREASLLLGVAEATVRTRLHRAKAQLRASLAHANPDSSAGRRELP